MKTSCKGTSCKIGLVHVEIGHVLRPRPRISFFSLGPPAVSPSEPVAIPPYVVQETPHYIKHVNSYDLVCYLTISLPARDNPSDATSPLETLVFELCFGDPA